MQHVQRQLRFASKQKDAINKTIAIDLNRHIKLLAKQKCDPQQILDVFNDMKENGSFYDADSYLIAQKSLIKCHCQNKHIKSAKKVWNELKYNHQYKQNIKQRDYFMVLSTFIDNQYPDTALQIFYEMTETEIKPDYGIYNMILAAASQLKSPKHATKIHQILKQNDPELIETHKSIQNSLIDMFLKCGDIINAQKIFQSMTNKKNVDTWNILLNGMISDNKVDDAFILFDEMIKQDIKPDCFTYSSIAKATKDSMDKANQIYDMIKNDSNINLYQSIVLCNSLIIMFGKCGNISAAMDVWNILCAENRKSVGVRSWNSIINVNYHHGEYQTVLDLYDELITCDNAAAVQPQIKTYHICIRACVHLENMQKAKEIVEHIKCNNWKGWKPLMKMYKSYNGLDKCIKLWKETSDEYDVKGFTLLIHLCIDDGDNMKAFELFDEMQNVYDIKPDVKTFMAILRACDNHLELIKEMHKQIISFGCEFYNDKDLVNMLMESYKKCGETKLARHVWKVYKAKKTIFG